LVFSEVFGLMRIGRLKMEVGFEFGVQDGVWIFERGMRWWGRRLRFGDFVKVDVKRCLCKEFNKEVWWLGEIET